MLAFWNHFRFIIINPSSSIQSNIDPNALLDLVILWTSPHQIFKNPVRLLLWKHPISIFVIPYVYIKII